MQIRLGGAIAIVLAPLASAAFSPARPPCDLNGDGKSDLVATSVGGMVTRVELDPGGSAEQVGFFGTTGWTIVGCGYLDADNKADLVYAGPNAIRIDRMNGTTVASRGWIGNGGGAFHVVAIADTDGDGEDDLILTDTTGALIRIDVMDGATVRARGWIAPNGTYRFGTTGDWDGNGKSDVLRQDGGPANAYGDEWLLNGAIATRVPGVVLLAGGGEPVFGAADAEGMGYEDPILDGANFTRFLTSAGSRFLSTGGGAWRPRLLADLNFDGRADLVSTSAVEPNWVRIALLADTIATPGGPVASAIGYVSTEGGGYQLADSGDFDGDGRADLVYRGASSIRIDFMDGLTVKSSVKHLLPPPYVIPPLLH